MPKWGTLFNNARTRKEKEYLLGLSSVIPTWNASYQFYLKKSSKNYWVK